MPEQNEQQEILDGLQNEFQDGYEGIDAIPFAAQFPRGQYKFVVTNAYVNRSAFSNRRQLVAATKTTDASTGDEYVGKAYTKTWGLENAQNLEWLKRDMLALDIAPPKDPRDILRIVNELMGVAFSGNLVPNREDPEQYPPNLFLNRGARIIDGGEGAEGSAGTPKEKDERF